MHKKVFLFFIPFLLAFSGYAQNKTSTWFELGFSKKVLKNLTVEFNPELRLLDSLKMDSYILEGGLSYKLHKYLTIAGYYRYENEWDYKNSTGAYKGQQSLNRLAFDAKSGIEKYRFNFQLRLRYTKGLDRDNHASEFRYRAKIGYDIKGIKLVPFASVELFHDQSVLAIERDGISGGLKSIDKIRYTGGLEYAINKNNEVTVFYRLQDNRVKNESVNIIGLGYSHDF